MSTTPQLVELVDDGPTQTVRIPAEFHLNAHQVEIRRNEKTGDLILARPRPKNWSEFFERINQSEPQPHFMEHRPLNVISVDRDIFADDAD